MRFAVLTVLLIALSPALAVARPIRPTGEQRALELFERSETEYRAGRFGSAADLLREAYGMHPVPILLYNLARALEGLGDSPGALAAYQSYLEADPEAEDRSSIEQRIETLRQQIDERATLDRQRQDALRERAVAEARLEMALRARATAEARLSADGRRGDSGGPGPLPWVATGMGVAGLAAGGLLSVLAVGQHNQAVDDPVQASAHESQESARRFADFANLSFVTGGVLTAVGIVWILLDGAGDHDDRPTEATELPSGRRRVLAGGTALGQP